MPMSNPTHQSIAEHVSTRDATYLDGKVRPAVTYRYEGRLYWCSVPEFERMVRGGVATWNAQITEAKK